MTEGQQNITTILPLLKSIAVILPFKSRLDDYQLLSSYLTDFYLGVYVESDYSLIESIPQQQIPLKTVRFIEPKESDAFEVIQQIKKQTVLADSEQLMVHQAYLPEPIFETERFKAQGFTNFKPLRALIETIKYDLPKAHHLPKFSAGNSAQLLRQLCFEGLKRLSIDSEQYHQRLEIELSTIHRMNYDDYFLIVWDLLQFGKKNHYYTGMGRGSAVGSLVAYALEITHIDPVKHQLLFERFLNPERFSMPDIDIDIPDIVRDQFIQYVYQKYGAGYVAQITTFGTFGAKMALRDVARVFGLSMNEALSLSKLVPAGEYGRKVGLKQAYQNKHFAEKINQRPIYQKIFQIASLLEGLPRHTSTHAAGVILSDVPLNQFLPLQAGNAEVENTQFDMYDVEAIGLLKMDFLGLRNLTWVQKMREMVEKYQHQKVDLYRLNFEDENVLKAFAQGNTIGIFQFEAAGMREMLKRMQPVKFEDLVSATSIYRPGPSQNIESFIRRRKGQEAISYYDDSIAELLKSTSGIILYQEQIMQIASKFAGFSLGKADLLRRAIGKKKQKEMQSLRQDFVQGAIQNGHTVAKADEIFDLIERFANYGFNRSHAYAYAAVAFQLMYFKVYYKATFYQVLLNDTGNDKKKRIQFLTDAIENHLKVELPNINTIHLGYLGGKALQIGLIGINGFNRELARTIIQLRKERQFSNLDDFIVRLVAANERLTTVENLTPLIQLGLLDNFQTNRRMLINALDKYITNAKLVNGTNASFLMSDLPIKQEACDDYTLNERMQFERDYLSIQLIESPLKQLASVLGHQIDYIASLKDQQEVQLLVEIIELKTYKTKKNNETMARLKLQDLRGEIEAVLFPAEYRAQIQKIDCDGPYFLVSGSARQNREHLEIIVRNVQGISQNQRLWLKVETLEASLIAKIKSICNQYRGTIPVFIFEVSKKRTEVMNRIFVNSALDLINNLKEIGVESVFRKKD
nr:MULTISPECIES: DNA polymerase III subunit alpha [unclassified Enterococcus]